MRRVEFVDTSILLNVLDVPGKNQNRAQVLKDLASRTMSGVQFVLPATTIIETGNHVSQLPRGDDRRRCGAALVLVLRQIIDGEAPWVLHEAAWDGDLLTTLCDGPPRHGDLVDLLTAQAMGTGDMAILAERNRYAARVSHVEVGVWTLDQRFAAYIS